MNENRHDEKEASPYHANRSFRLEERSLADRHRVLVRAFESDRLTALATRFGIPW
jgi:hypothetical protein